MKTLEGWHERGKTNEKNDWDDYCKPGNEVDREVYDYFLDIMPPRTMRRGYFQVGEPKDHRKDDDGKWKGTYMTFAVEEQEDGSRKYVYLGNCFPGKWENQP